MMWVSYSHPPPCYNNKIISLSIDLMVSLEQAAYVALENASSLEVCVIIVNGPDIVPQMEMSVTVFATNFNDSDKGM